MMRRVLQPLLFALIAAPLVALAPAPALAAPDAAQPSSAIKIEDVVSPGGIHAWLVESKTVPVIAVEVSFMGGSRLDAESKAGTSAFMASLLDEGAGTMDSQAFKKALEDKAIRMGFGADDDTVSASLRALAPYTQDAFRLFSLALTQPRFDSSAIERVRAQILVGLKEQESDPPSIASKAWFANALKGEPYAMPVYGTTATIKGLKREDILNAYKHELGRDRMKIAVVGPIDAATLGPLLDQTFGALPLLGLAPDPPLVEVTAQKAPIIIERDIPQSVVTFGGPAMKATDPDFMAAYVMNYVLGGGGFASRLMDEIREKRGLTYGIGTGLVPFQSGGLLMGSFSSRNAVYGLAYKLLIQEMNRMAEGGVTDEELKDAKTYLTGSYAMNFDSNEAIASQLNVYQVEGRDIGYVNRRNDLVNAVTKEDVARLAKRLLKPEAMLFVVVGKPNTSEEGPLPPPVEHPEAPAEPSESMSLH